MEVHRDNFMAKMAASSLAEWVC
ncbi:hypothetical protein ACILPN_18095 [Yersinia wautersii]